MSVASCVASLLSSASDIYAWLDSRYDLADFQQHHEQAVHLVRRTGQAWATVAGLAFPVARLPNQVDAPPPAPVTRDVSIDVKHDRDGLFICVVSCDKTGALLVVSPAVSDVDGAITAARHMYASGNLILNGPQPVAPRLPNPLSRLPAVARYV